MFKRRVEVDLVSLAIIAASHALIMYGLVEIAYAAGKSVGKIELRNELVMNPLLALKLMKEKAWEINY